MTDLTHPEEIQLHAYLDGELSHDERSSVDQHLEVCSECARKIERNRNLFDMLEQMPQPDLLLDLVPGVLATIRRSTAIDEPGLMPFNRTARLILSVQFLLGMVLIVLTLGFLFPGQWDRLVVPAMPDFYSSFMVYLSQATSLLATGAENTWSSLTAGVRNLYQFWPASLSLYAALAILAATGAFWLTANGLLLRRQTNNE